MTFRRRNIVRHGPDQWASEHERARHLSALALSEPLGDDDAPWLEAHLESCEPCRVVAAEYATEQALLRALPKAEPPRDLWARTQTALDAERRRGRPAGPRPNRPGRLVLVPIMASLAVAFSVVSVTFLSSPSSPGPTGAPPITASPVASVLVAATPIAVAAADVAWVKRSGEGTYDLIVAPVTQVCDADARPDCPPLAEPVTQTIALPDEPQAVLRSPADPSLVVVETRAASGIGGVYAVSPATIQPTAEPSASPTGQPTPAVTEPLPSGEPTPLATLTVTPAPTEPPSPSPGATEPVPPSVAPTATATASPPGPSPSASGEPTAVPILTGVILTGSAPAFSADGTWLAFSARPANGSYGSDVYVWRAGEPVARALTTDHRAFFSSWVEGSIIASRVLAVGPDPLNPQPAPTDAGTSGPPAELPVLSPEPTAAVSPQPTAAVSPEPTAAVSPEPTAAPSPVPAPEPSVMPLDLVAGQMAVTVSDRLRVRSQPWVGDDSIRYEPLLPLGTQLQVLGGPVEGSDYTWYQVTPIGFGLYDGPGYGWVATAGHDGEPWIAPAPEPRTTEQPAGSPDPSIGLAPVIGLPQSMILDPATGLETVLPAEGIWRPVVDPAQRTAVFWRGMLAFDPLGGDWHPSDGRLVVATWSPLEGLLPAGQGTEPGPDASPSPAPTGMPEAEPTPLATPAGTVGPSPGPSDSAGPEVSPTPSASPGPTLPPFPAPLDLLSLSAGPLSDWDVSWDASGSHVALWLGDALTESFGLLSLYPVDSASGMPLTGTPQLASVPALHGYSLSDDRLAWASPPGQGGEGSRLLVLAWEGDAAGQVESQPSSEESPVLVVR